MTVTLTLDRRQDHRLHRRGQGRDPGRRLHGHRPAARRHRRERQHCRGRRGQAATVTSNAIKEAAAAALTAAGLNPDDYKTAVETNTAEPAEDSTVDADVVIVGAGGAGMTAAITAADEGKSVVILESQPMVGGNSVRATGGMNAGKTVYQDENEFGESAGVEKTLKTAAEKYADNETITALAKTVSEQWAAYQADPKGYFDSCGADGAGHHDRRQGS